MNRRALIITSSFTTVAAAASLAAHFALPSSQPQEEREPLIITIHLPIAQTQQECPLHLNDNNDCPTTAEYLKSKISETPLSENAAKQLPSFVDNEYPASPFNYQL